MEPLQTEPRGPRKKGGGADTRPRSPSSLFRSISQAFAQNGATELGIEEIRIGRAGLLSLSLYTWLTPLVWRLYRRGVGSVLNLRWMEEDTTEVNVQRLERAWKAEVRAQGSQGARLGRAIRVAYTARIAASCALVVITLSFSFVGSAFILRRLLEQVENADTPLWQNILVVCGLLGCELCRSLTFSLAWCYNYWTGMRVRSAAMGLLYRKMLRLRSMKDKKVGELVNLCSNDGQRLYEVMANGPFVLGGPLVFIAGSVYLAVLLGPWALVGVGTFVLLFVLMKLVSDGLQHYRMQAVTLTGERVGLMTEVITCMKLIKMNAWEPSFMARIAAKRGDEQRALEKASFLQSIITSLVPMVPVIAAVLMFIAYILNGNDLDVALAFTVVAVLYAISFALALMMHGIRTVADANVACTRYTEVLLMEEVIPFPTDVDDGDNAIEMTAATFAWEGEEMEVIEPTDEDSVVAGITPEDFDPLSSSFSGRHAHPSLSRLSCYLEQDKEEASPAKSPRKHSERRESEMDLLEQGAHDSTAILPQLTGVNLSVKKGDLVGICGMKGAGKSSLLAAIMGRLQLSYGDAKIKGRVAYVGQEPWIFNGTARDNITFGCPYDPIKFERVVSACSLDKDFDTFGAADLVEIGDRGVTLSGGQKQRVCLARAMYSDSDILLLDDPFSALDVALGRHVFAQCLVVMLKAKTVLLVTHHLEYLPKCDQVLLLHEGRIAEAGPHCQLMHSPRGQMYTELYQLYTSKYEKIQRHRLMSSLAAPEPSDVKTPQRGFSRMSLHQLTRQLTRMSTKGDFQHQFSTMSTTSGIFSSYDVDFDDLEDASLLYTTRVNLGVYRHYVRAMGGVCVLLFLMFAFALSIAVQSAATAFLSYWLEQGDGSVYNASHLVTMANASLNDSEGPFGRVVDNPHVAHYATVYGLFVVAMLVIMVVRSWVFVKILLRAATKLHRKLLKRTLTCPMKFFDATPLGIILNRFSADIDEIDVRLPSNLELYLQNVFLVVSALAVICYTFPLALLIVLPLIIAFLGLASAFAPTIQQLKFVDSITRSPYLSHLAASIEGTTTINTYGQTERFFKQFCGMLDRNNIPFFLFYMANRWVAVFLDLMAIAVIAVIGFLTVFTMAGSHSSQVGLALSFAIQITSLLQYTLRLTIETGSRFSSVQRVQEYIEDLQVEGAIASSGSEVPEDWPSEGAITFNKFNMRYTDTQPPALKAVTLSVKPKERIGIVGHSGSGKSSLGVALFRLAEAASGAIYIDDRNIRDVKLSALRSRISILVQDPVLFVGTIRYNLDPAGAHAGDEDLWNVLGKCHMKEKIASLEKQLDTMVEENGRNFSMGERQLLCLARTLLRNNRILVLDEATASVDTRTDLLVQQTIREYCRDHTVLTIAHRINTIWDSDKVLVMDRGKAVEYNQPHLLLQKQTSKFKDMWDALKSKPRGESFNEDDYVLSLSPTHHDDAFS